MLHAEASSVCAVVAWSWLAVLRDALDASLRLVPPDLLSAVPRVTLHQGGGGWRRMSIAAFSGELHQRQKPNVAAGSGGRFSLDRLSRTLDRPTSDSGSSSFPVGWRNFGCCLASITPVSPGKAESGAVPFHLALLSEAFIKHTGHYSDLPQIIIPP